MLRETLPAESFDEAGQFSMERYLAHARKMTEMANKIAHSADVTLVRHKLLVIVDLQGIYLAVMDWLKAAGFGIESGLLVSRFSIFLMQSVMDTIEAAVVAEAGNDAMRFADLEKVITDGKFENLRSLTHVVKFEPAIELFFAPAPLDEIDWQLQKHARYGSVMAAEQLADIRNGIINLHGRERDYRFYEDFIHHLKHDERVTRSERGFFNFYVGPKGLQFIDEKEVDIRIAIRAVDACVDYEADSICIISSDQDFIPLHERCRKAGVQTYQADVAKFASPDKVGRKIRELGVHFIPTGIAPDWALRAITEACAPFAFYRLSMTEFEGLCRIHNDLNEVQIAPHVAADGTVGLRMYRPVN